eukprot:m.937121 g.937121  ORF g.937121 m.937121 type:complete len:203 (+) comp23813_c1_seq14:702-1310(+)
MPAEEFINKCNTQRPGRSAEYVYFTSKIDDLPPSFRKICDKQAVESLICDPVASGTPGASEAYASVWIGGPGSTTQAHYDVSHNLFTQVHGSKRFRLWGPQHHWEMQVFPDAHPRARKAQRQVDADHGGMPDVSTDESTLASHMSTPRSLQLPFLDVEIHPGDALFIPAFWFHHVEASGPGAYMRIVLLVFCHLYRVHVIRF